MGQSTSTLNSGIIRNNQTILPDLIWRNVIELLSENECRKQRHQWNPLSLSLISHYWLVNIIAKSTLRITTLNSKSQFIIGFPLTFQRSYHQLNNNNNNNNNNIDRKFNISKFTLIYKGITDGTTKIDTSSLMFKLKSTVAAIIGQYEHRGGNKMGQSTSTLNSGIIHNNQTILPDLIWRNVIELLSENECRKQRHQWNPLSLSLISHYWLVNIIAKSTLRITTLNNKSQFIIGFPLTFQRSYHQLNNNNNNKTVDRKFNISKFTLIYQGITDGTTKIDTSSLMFKLKSTVGVKLGVDRCTAFFLVGGIVRRCRIASQPEYRLSLDKQPTEESNCLCHSRTSFQTKQSKLVFSSAAETASLCKRKLWYYDQPDSTTTAPHEIANESFAWRLLHCDTDDRSTAANQH
ncbi:hypothetical protein PPL_06756 [Heterostelium album PN500]|uniref:Uncharacterized protein n=1 Tax=Heterostelium pallidum (strain ATCC 26659 / Pp 5 / PN500) TaxID=670386 RepID=D3BFM1_HETP5|nr:hypothetical protein PPL_06756 [Heterostelium album PN500]EFA79935.1 hypothetical protein PPL_06756 [Heterostelium album PN500]|eukprot:XP_020432055.1 hypothetical protein PPL_06756 [Heterostelium album PN500]